MDRRTWLERRGVCTLPTPSPEAHCDTKWHTIYSDTLLSELVPIHNYYCTHYLTDSSDSSAEDIPNISDSADSSEIIFLRECLMDPLTFRHVDSD